MDVGKENKNVTKGGRNVPHRELKKLCPKKGDMLVRSGGICLKQVKWKVCPKKGDIAEKHPKVDLRVICFLPKISEKLECGDLAENCA